MVKPVKVGRHTIGPEEPVFVIAEAGVCHDGSEETALKMVDTAGVFCADAVKFQMFTASKLKGRSPGVERLLADRELSQASFQEIKRRCVSRGVMFLCTPFSPEDVDRLLALGVEAFKVASPGLKDYDLLRKVAGTGLPVIASTGGSTEQQIRTGVDILRDGGAEGRLILLHCISKYPADMAELNLRRISWLRDAFQTPVGFSDHSLSEKVGAYAVGAGACVLEKHFTLDRGRDGPDHHMALEPAAFVEYVIEVRKVEIVM